MSWARISKHGFIHRGQALLLVIAESTDGVPALHETARAMVDTAK